MGPGRPYAWRVSGVHDEEFGSDRVDPDDDADRVARREAYRLEREEHRRKRTERRERGAGLGLGRALGGFARSERASVDPSGEPAARSRAPRSQADLPATVAVAPWDEEGDGALPGEPAARSRAPRSQADPSQESSAGLWPTSASGAAWGERQGGTSLGVATSAQEEFAHNFGRPAGADRRFRLGVLFLAAVVVFLAVATWQTVGRLFGL